MNAQNLKCLFAYLILSASLLFVSPANAQEQPDEQIAQGREEGAETRHHLSVILSASTLVEDGATGFTYGIDYEYELTERLGIGFVIERAEGNVNSTTLLAVTDFHIVPGFVLQLGPGVEFAEGETFLAGRAGLLYEIELDNWVLAPGVSYDLSEGADAVVYGITIGRRF